MSNEVILKQFNIDYSFIIRNYLNPELWTKKWTLLVYKSFVFTLNLAYIDTEEEKVIFRIMLLDKNESEYKGLSSIWAENKVTSTISYNLKIDDIKFLKTMINSEMQRVLRELETQNIKGTDEYIHLENSMETEENTLREIANDFLDAERVTNDNIREAYIDRYIDDNLKISSYLNAYVERLQYTRFTDLYLLLANLHNNKELLTVVEESNSNRKDFKNLQKEIQEYIDNMETEEFREELSQNLEDI